MEFLSSRDLRLKPKEIWKRLKKEKFGVVTLNGKPQFLLSLIEPNELEKMLYLFNRIRAEIAVEEMQRTAKEKGLDKMSLKDINQEIREVREENAKKNLGK